METLQESTSLSTERFGFTLFLSICVHSVIILGVGLGLVEHFRQMPVLQVTLAQQRSEQPLQEADLPAQTKQNAEAEKRQDDSPTKAKAVQQQQEIPAREVLTANNAEIKQGQTEEEDDISVTLSGLQAQLDQQRQAYAKRPRRYTISSASTQESRDARYLDAWRKRIEAVGNHNYPEAASNQGVYGNLRLLVALHFDGSVDEIRILRSSGHPLLDEAAIRIVKQAAPFAPFPDDMRKETDILEIIRTWQFQPGDSFSSY